MTMSTYVADSYDKTTDQFCQTINAQGGYRWVRFHPHGRPRTRLYDDVIPRTQYEAELIAARPTDVQKADIVDVLSARLAQADAVIFALDESLRFLLDRSVWYNENDDGKVTSVVDAHGTLVIPDERILATLNVCLSR